MRPSILLWFAFAALVVTAGVVLLQACGLVVPAALDDWTAWRFCPQPPQSFAADAEREAALRREIARLQLELTQRALACASVPPPPPPPLELPQRSERPRPQQTAELKPPPPPPKVDLPEDKWKKKDLSLLEGCWQLGRESRANVSKGGREEECINQAGRICFDAHGTGTRYEDTACPTLGFMRCQVGVRAYFHEDGSLRTEQPDSRCDDGTRWVGHNSGLNCQRVNERTALCRDFRYEHEFRR